MCLDGVLVTIHVIQMILDQIPTPCASSLLSTMNKYMKNAQLCLHQHLITQYANSFLNGQRKKRHGKKLLRKTCQKIHPFKVNVLFIFRWFIPLELKEIKKRNNIKNSRVRDILSGNESPRHELICTNYKWIIGIRSQKNHHLQHVIVENLMNMVGVAPVIMMMWILHQVILKWSRNQRLPKLDNRRSQDSTDLISMIPTIVQFINGTK